jgi:hypothetical protein
LIGRIGFQTAYLPLQERLLDEVNQLPRRAALRLLAILEGRR